jgi:hypothetical protein
MYAPSSVLTMLLLLLLLLPLCFTGNAGTCPDGAC